jgi:hypothetical protein
MPPKELLPDQHRPIEWRKRGPEPSIGGIVSAGLDSAMSPQTAITINKNIASDRYLISKGPLRLPSRDNLLSFSLVFLFGDEVLVSQ